MTSMCSINLSVFQIFTSWIWDLMEPHKGMVWRPATEKPLYSLFDVSKSPDFMDILAFCMNIITNFKTITGMNQRLLCYVLQSFFLFVTHCPTFALICEVMQFHSHCSEQMILLCWFNFELFCPEKEKTTIFWTQIFIQSGSYPCNCRM
jgi:hypothetical protein